MIAAVLVLAGLGVTAWVVLADPDLDLLGRDTRDEPYEPPGTPYYSLPPYAVPTVPATPSTGASNYPGPSYSPSPSRTPDPLDKAFAVVRTGDCVSAYYSGLEWNRNAPYVVSCSAADAYMYVASTRDDATCAASGRGRTFWSHTNDDGSLVKLCLERRFRAGQCFLATKAGDSMQANLSTLWDCNATTVPKDYTYIMKITGLLPGNSNVNYCPGDSRKTHSGWLSYDGYLVCAENAL
ncbi:hypothetical protein [Embleya sp. NPDC020886]|uniref:LppU/SCO3897 family protein n=1 Tax=Embleya sp. NPDC020886 TaxID=3363980 RepID=UPI00379104B6